MKQRLKTIHGSAAFWLLLLTLCCTSMIYGQGKVTPDQALVRLKEGNLRFVNGKSDRPRQDFSRIKEVAVAQHPFATIVGCYNQLYLVNPGVCVSMRWTLQSRRNGIAK